MISGGVFVLQSTKQRYVDADLCSVINFVLMLYLMVHNVLISIKQHESATWWIEWFLDGFALFKCLFFRWFGGLRRRDVACLLIWIFLWLINKQQIDETFEFWNRVAPVPNIWISPINTAIYQEYLIRRHKYINFSKGVYLPINIQ